MAEQDGNPNQDLTQKQAPSHGTIVGRYLLSTHPDEVSDFFHGLFGWEREKNWLRRDGRPVAGLMKVAGHDRAPRLSLWTVCVAVDGLGDQAGERRRKVPRRRTEHGVGYVLHADPRGGFTVPVSGFERAAPEAPGAAAEGEAGDRYGFVCWDQLNTGDLAAANEHYARLYGWKVARTPIGTAFHREGRAVAGASAMPSGANLPDHWVPFVWVAAVRRAIERTRELGGGVVVEESAVDGVDAKQGATFAVLHDPTGGLFGVCQPPTADPRVH